MEWPVFRPAIAPKAQGLEARHSERSEESLFLPLEKD